MTKKTIFLVGFMGSGKSTWGRKLANATGRPFLDLDNEIVQNIGMSIPEYFAQFGEERFRIEEREILHKLQTNTGIISTGGGTPCYFDNMQWLLENGTVIYLRHSPKSLWSRLSKSDVQKRPALKGLTDEALLAFIKAKLEEREPYYLRAHRVVDQLHTTLEELIDLTNNLCE